MIVALLVIVCCCVAANIPKGYALAVEAFYIEDAAEALAVDTALDLFRDGDGVPLANARFNQGNRESRFWIYLRVNNTDDKPVQSVLDTGVPFRAGLTVYQFGAGRLPATGHSTIVLQTSDRQSFSDRDPSGLILHSHPMTLLPGAGLELLLDYTTRGSTYMPLSLSEPAVFASEQQHEALSSVFFYTASGSLLLIFFMLGIALKDSPMLLYAGLFCVGLLFVAAVEGYGFQYVWPDYPMWNQYAGLFLLFVAISMGFLIAWYAAAPQALSAATRRLLLVLAAISAGLAMACAQLPFSPLIDAAGVLALIAYLVQVFVVISWLRQSFRRYLGSFVAVLVVVPFIVVLTLLGLLGFDLPDLVFNHATRAVYLVSVVGTLAALTLHVTGLRMDYEDSLERALQSAERDASLSRALLEAEQKYNQARESAIQYKQRLAANAHDIRQPLTALRSVLDSLGLQTGSKEQATLQAALDYIEQLSRPAGGSVEREEESALPDRAVTEPYRADLLLHTVRSMFHDEAASRSIRLTASSCSQLLQQPPLVLMRILTNLTSNAVLHCGSGRIVLGCRRAGGSVRYDVIDNGPGIAAVDIPRVQRPYESGSASEGEGLGLAICWQLAEQYGFTMGVDSVPGKGSRFSVTVPLTDSK